MKFKQFIVEKYLEGSRAPLYHWTGDYNLRSILKHQKLGYAADDGYTATDGITKFKPGWVSFTRDKNYRVHGHRDTNLRLSFDSEKLKHKGHKIEPYVDRSVVKNALDHDSRLNQHDARFEAEEIVMGPIPLDHGLIAIEGTPELIKHYKELIKKWTETKEKNLKLEKDVKDGMKFTIKFWMDEQGQNFSEKLSGEWVKKAKAELEKDPNWKPKWFTSERYKQRAKSNQALIDEYTNYLRIIKPIT